MYHDETAIAYGQTFPIQTLIIQNFLIIWTCLSGPIIYKHLYLFNIFDYPESQLSGLLSPVSTSVDNQGLTAICFKVAISTWKILKRSGAFTLFLCLTTL